jgi:voltage-gated potassium channel
MTSLESEGQFVVQQLSIGFALVAVTVLIHASALSWLLWRSRRSPAPATILHDWWAFILIAITCIFAHLVEIMLWAAYYAWEGSFAGLHLAGYFSAVTYATIGYGDVIPPPHLRLLAAMEGLTGILMCAWSGGFFFAIVTQVWERRHAGGAGR